MPGKTARFIQVLVAVAVGALVAGGGFATAAALIGSDDVKDNSLRSRDVMDGTLRCKDLREQLCSMAKAGGQKGDTGAKGDPGAKGDKGDKGDPGVTNLEADGPYPGAGDLGDLPGQGDNSDDLWAHDGTRQTSWVQCPPGKTALGGGFHQAADAGDDAARDVQVVVSEPTQIKAGAVTYEPIPGDAAGSVKPNGWLVQGFNEGAADVVVRPWVVCAEVG
jgi:hypothetical protein